MRKEELEDGEWLSALADGQLRGEAFASALARLDASDEALSVWHAYHVAGDVLRSADLAACGRDRAFVAGLRARLGTDQVLERPVAYLSGDPTTSALPSPPVHGVAYRHSANDAVVRWKWLAGVASVVAVSILGWHMSQPSGAAQLAQAQPTPPVLAGAQPGLAEPPVMLRDPRLDELLAAHRQVGGLSVLQMPAGFLRNATFEQTGR